MPPLVPRKRLQDTPPSDERKVKKTEPGAARRKATLYDDLDASATPQSSKHTHSVLQGLDESDSSSSLTSLSDEVFEDVQPRWPDKGAGSDDDDIEFENVEAPQTLAADPPVPSGDLELTLNRDTRISLINPYGDKKGPTKRERKVRNATHCVHVLLLLWHNAIRNSWLCDEEVQATMVSHLPPRLWEEVERWRRSSGLQKPPALKGPAKEHGKHVKSKSKKDSQRKSREWGDIAEKLEEGAVDMSHGDPLFRLMQTLVAWWKQRFRSTTPGIRKRGYMSLERLDRLTKAFAIEAHDAVRFGERISNLEDFRNCARTCEGSRDVGAQLFTSLLRGLGLEARMVANIQPLGFGWNKLEDAELEEEGKNESQDTSEEPSTTTQHTTPTSGKKTYKQSAKKQPSKSSTNTRQSGKRGKQKQPAVINDSDDLEVEYKDTDDESVVELKVTPRKGPAPARKFDNDLEYPHYWTEVLSPVTSKYIPVDSIVKTIIGTNRELIESLEPRGAKADKARQTMAYIVGFSQDGTAKDVTIRYLRRNTLPGRTKGVRMSLEKVPVYNKHGKIKRYEQFDWFKTAMSGYGRGTRKYPLSEVDEIEDGTDLVSRKPEKREIKEGEETLQYYKQSKEFVLERHLKREEALKSRAQPVKVFKGKGKGGKVEEEDVYLRNDVLHVKSAETWHKQGRAPISGEQPLKRVPYRAATTNRRREIMEAEAATGEKVLQGLFSIEQTDWIIPPPIRDGIIPKNEYGNIDLFVEHMCPEGAVHVPFRGAMRVCKRLQVDYAEAVVDFEFGHRMAVPVIQGVVIAEEYYEKVMEELKKDEAERTRKEDEKRRKAALNQWRKFLMGMRIADRLRQDYGDVDGSISVFVHSRDHNLPALGGPIRDEEAMAGGFLPEGYEEDEEVEVPAHHTSSFFPAIDEDYDGEDGLVMEDQGSRNMQAGSQPVTPDAVAQKRRYKATSPKQAKSRVLATRRSTRNTKKTVNVDDTDEDNAEIHDGNCTESDGMEG